MMAKLLPLIPEHYMYVEPFGGGASLLFAKELSPVEVYNDIDSGLVNLFRVLRDEAKFQRFYRKACLTPYSREEYLFCRNTWDEQEDDVERAYRFFVVARQSFSGRFGGGWSFSRTASRNNMAKTCSKWLSCLEMLPEIHERLMQVQIEHLDFRKIFENYDTPETFFLCDPPYIPDTRKAGEYRHEMTLQDHQDLVGILLRIQGKAILCGYKHDIYKPLEDTGWHRLEFQMACHAVGRTRATGILGEGTARRMQPRTECVWLSSNHDYLTKNKSLPSLP